MKIVQAEDVPLQRSLEYRGGMFHGRRVLEGEPGTVDNFQLQFGQSSGDFYSPRHRHNFEQFRLQIEGNLDFGRDGAMRPGMIGYFPEGVYYGPQSQKPEEKPLTAVLQFGGASGSGYLSRAESKQAMDELLAFGEFKDGVYRRKPGVPGKKNVDAYQALWEHTNQRPLDFPKPRYEKPIFMDSAHYAWVPMDGQPGVAEKIMGVFTERRSEAAFVKLDAGASFTGAGRGIYVGYSGGGSVEGQPLKRLTTVYLDKGETARFKASETTVLVHFGLPNLAGMALPKREPLTAQAAE
jgi:hypothetical protein